jgi:hypothetical protein
MTGTEIFISKFSNLPEAPEVAAGNPEKYVRRIHKLGLNTLLGVYDFSKFGDTWQVIMDDMLEAGANFGTPDMIDAYTYYLNWAELLRARLGIRFNEKSSDSKPHDRVPGYALKKVQSEINSMRQFVITETT